MNLGYLERGKACAMQRGLPGKYIHYIVKDRNLYFTYELFIVYDSNNMEERKELYKGIIKILKLYLCLGICLGISIGISTPH